jgi:riboflavin kinase/FMN adenylyltransferase
MLVTHGSLEPARDAHAVTVGNFDGVHLGHRAMLERVTAAAREHGVRSCALTFEPHPREFFTPDSAPPRLTPLREKLELIATIGVDRAHVLHFDAALAAEPAEHFVEQILVRGLGTRWLLVGRDFRFGARRSGDLKLLEAQASRHGYSVETMPDVQLGGERVSSSAVRAALERGDFALASKLLGRPYEISGRVAHGAKLGRQLGFPTANIPLAHRPPLSGIYVVEACRTDLGEPREWLPGVASVGRRPTVNQVEKPLLEVFLFDFGDEIYDHHLKVRFLQKLRDERKFADLETLRAAIADDAQRAREYFASLRDRSAH